MNIAALFPTPLLTSLLPGSEQLCADLRAIILEREALSPGVAHSNKGGWQSDDTFLEWSGQCGEILLAAVREAADRFTGVVENAEIVRKRIDWKVNAWANVIRSGGGNHLHYHPGCFWSGVFYVDDGGIGGAADLGGAIEFVDPRGPAPLMHAPSVKMTIAQCVSAGLGERVYPSTGLFVMFPSWLGHRVTPYTGARERISVALNFSV